MSEKPQHITASEIVRRMKDSTTPAAQALGRAYAVINEPILDALLALMHKHLDKPKQGGQ